MKKSKIYFLNCFFVVLILLLAFTISLTSKENYKTFQNDVFTLKWRFTGNNLEIIMKGESEGWVAIGFDPTNVMKDADIYIGYVKDGKTYIDDQYGNTMFSHKSDTKLGGKNNIINYWGKQEGDFTEIGFVIPVNSGDKYDKKFIEGKTYTVLLACGKKDNFTTKHSYKAKVKIKL